MGKSQSPPAAPDYTAAATAQGAANVDAARVQARLSNPNVVSPYGNQTVTYGSPVFDQAAYDKAMAAYNTAPSPPAPSPAGLGLRAGQGGQGGYAQGLASYTPTTQTAASSQAPTREQFTTNPTQDTPTITQTLNPTSQALFDKEQAVKLGLADVSSGAIDTVKDVMGTPFSSTGPGVQNSLDLSGLAAMPVNAGTTGQEALMSRYGPQNERERAAVETQLRNQGLVPGGEAYGNAMTIQNQRENDLKAQAALMGVNLDLSANQQGFNQALQSGQFANTAQGQGLQQQLYQRELPLNEISALMSGSQITNPQFPGYSGVGVQAAPVMQAAQNQYNAGLQSYGMQNDSNNAMFSGLMGLGGAAVGAPWFGSAMSGLFK